MFHFVVHIDGPPRSDAGFPADDRGHECRRTPEHRLKILRPHVRHTGTFHLVRQVPVPFFGISTNGFRIAGGIIIFKIGYDMLQAHFTHVKLNENEKKEYSRNITVTPLAVPMLCGPGVISSGITLMEDAPEHIFKIALVCVIALVCLLSFIILCVSTRLLKILGETGNNVMMRLMGLILMVIAVECFINGMQPVLTDILRQAHACP